MAFNARFYYNRLVKAKAISPTTDFADKGGAALDYCPDTYETGILTSSQCALDIDADATLSAGNVTAGFTFAAVWLRNYPSAGFGASATLTVQSDNADTFASPTTRGTLTFSTAGISATQHLLLVTFASQDERYWRYDFSNMSGGAPQVAMVMLGNYDDVTRTWDIGGPPHGSAVQLRRHQVRHFNRVDEMPDGRHVTMNMRSRGAGQWPLAWSLLDKTNYEVVANVHNYCRGSFIPFVFAMDDATAMASHFLCRFATDAPEVSEPAHQLYNISVPIEEIPSTDSTEVY